MSEQPVERRRRRGGDVAATEIGTAVHALLEHDRPRRPGRAGARGRAGPRASSTAYCESELARRVAALEGVAKERHFTFEHDGVLVHGFLDVLPSRGRPRARRRLQDERARRGARRRRSSRRTTGCSGSSTRSRASAPGRRRSRSSTSSSSGRTRRCEARLHAAPTCPRSRRSCRRRSRAIQAGEFRPTPSEFACAGCPALDLVCAGPAPAPAADARGRCLVATCRRRRKRVGPKRQRIRPIIERLAVEHADAAIALRFRSPLELLVSVMLSAQTTDVNVNRVTRDAVREVPPARGLPRRAAGGARARHLRDRLLPAEGEVAARDDADAARGVRRRGAAAARGADSACPASRARRRTSSRPSSASRRGSSSTRTSAGSRSGSG